MIVERRTLASEVEIEGLGLQFGEPVKVRLVPGSGGIVFHGKGARVEAKASNITETEYCTRLGSFSTIEHLMSALAGCEVTDVDVVMSAFEAPAAGGAASEWVSSIRSAGFESIGKRHLAGPFARIFRHNDAKSEKIALGLGTGHWKYVFHSKTKYPFDEEFETTQVVEDFEGEIAPARTFSWQSELGRIEASGLARGLREGDYVLIGDRQPLNEMRFPNEPTRHKLLDAIGDVYLAGVPIRFLNFVGEASGHRLNVEAAVRLAESVRWED